MMFGSRAMAQKNKQVIMDQFLPFYPLVGLKIKNFKN